MHRNRIISYAAIAKKPIGLHGSPRQARSVLPRAFPDRTSPFHQSKSRSILVPLDGSTFAEHVLANEEKVMRYSALACDFDGTLVENGKIHVRASNIESNTDISANEVADLSAKQSRSTINYRFRRRPSQNFTHTDTSKYNSRPMSEAHKDYFARSKRLPQRSSDVHDRRKGRSAIVYPDQRFLEVQIDRWINEGGALSPKRSSHQGQGFDG